MAATAPDTAYSLWHEGGAADAPFIVAAMFTPSYRPLAERLRGYSWETMARNIVTLAEENAISPGSLAASARVSSVPG